MISPAALFMIGGCLMMLEPILRGPVAASTGSLAAALREAFPPAPGAPRAFTRLLEQMP